MAQNDVDPRAEVKDQEARGRFRTLFLDLFEGVLRGVGVVSGCRRCQEVCPVGTDYDGIMIDRVDQIAEASSAKQDKLDKMMKVESEGSMPGVFATNERWIGSEP